MKILFFVSLLISSVLCSYLSGLDRSFSEADFNMIDLYVTMPPEEVEKLIDTVQISESQVSNGKSKYLDDFEYKNATIVTKLNGEEMKFENVKFKTGGMYARSKDKVGFNFKLDKKFLGRKQLRIRPDSNDKSYMRSKISCDMANRMGVPSIQSAYARLYMNDEFWGLYILMDAIKTSWVKQTFKPKEDEVTGLIHCKNKGMTMKLGTEANCINANDDYPDMTKFNEFIKQVNEATTTEELEKIMDVDVFLKFMAMEWLIGSFDHFLVLGHNFYFYQRETDNKWVIIEYDYDNTYGNGISSPSYWMNKKSNKSNTDNNNINNNFNFGNIFGNNTNFNFGNNTNFNFGNFNKNNNKNNTFVNIYNGNSTVVDVNDKNNTLVDISDKNNTSDDISDKNNTSDDISDKNNTSDDISDKNNTLININKRNETLVNINNTLDNVNDRNDTSVDIDIDIDNKNNTSVDIDDKNNTSVEIDNKNNTSVEIDNKNNTSVDTNNKNDNKNNNMFGGFGNGMFGGFGSMPSTNYIEYSFADWELDLPIIKILVHDNPERFKRIVREVLVSAFNPAILDEHIDQIREFLLPYVEEDTTPNSDGTLPGRINKKGSKGKLSISKFESEIIGVTNGKGIKSWIKGKFEVACKQYELDPEEIMKESLQYIPKSYDYENAGKKKVDKKKVSSDKKKKVSGDKKKKVSSYKKKINSDKKKKVSYNKKKNDYRKKVN